jgi:formate/nitrite transporter FocA (FNT family)
VLIISYVVGIGEFAHVVAGSVEGLFLALGGAFAVTDFVFRFFLPTLAGNTLGGVLLVAAVNHAQTAAEK